MKKFLPFLSIALFFVACNGKPAETETQIVKAASNQADTAGLAQFQQWKAQNELAVANDVQQPITSTPVTVIREVIVEREAPVRKRVRSTETSSYPNTAPNNNNSTSENESTVSESSSTASEPVIADVPAKNEGWSKSAKGAAIGGAGGAVLGAIINKRNPAVGAAIGGVLGGAGGYGIGRSKDKKDGLY